MSYNSYLAIVSLCALPLITMKYIPFGNSEMSIEVVFPFALMCLTSLPVALKIASSALVSVVTFTMFAAGLG